MDGRIIYPTGFCWDNIIAYGTTGMICLDEASQTVVKFPHRDEDKASIDVERQIYEEFQKNGGHKNIVRYHGLHEHSIRLEYIPNFNFEAYLSAHEVDFEQKLQWAQQIIDALCFVHSMHVIHGDLNIYNILLDKNLNAKLADFAGSSLKGSPLLVVVTASHRSPGDTLCIQGDIFAFGSTLYKITTGFNPYHDRTEREIETLFLMGSFPETNFLGPLGEVISKCWRGKYKNTYDVYQELKAISAHSSAKAYSINPVQLSLTFVFIGIAIMLGRRSNWRLLGWK